MRLATWAVNKPKRALLGFVLLLFALGATAGALGGTFSNSFELPDSESATATELLAETSAAEAAAGAQARVVWSSDEGAVTDPAVAATMEPYLAELAGLDVVSCVTSPYQTTYGDCAPPQMPDPTELPPEQAQALTPAIEATVAATSPISQDGSVAYATADLVLVDDGITPEQAKAFLAVVERANEEDGLTVGASGTYLAFAEAEPPALGEAVGVTVALIILLIAFGSLVLAGLPIVTALFGLAGGLALVVVVANFFDVATFGPTLAAMIGLGVGIDYALFITNRFRQSVLTGHDPKAAALESVHTSGRAVAFAAVAVVIALSGQFVLGLSFFYGLAMAAIVTVFMMALSALWLLPALLSLLGARAFAVRMPWAKKQVEWSVEDNRFAAYGGLLQKRPWVTAGLALVVLVLVAVPNLSMRQGFPDDSGRPADSSMRIGYDLLAQGWGPGINGPFFVAVELPEPGDTESAAVTIAALNETEGVAGTLPTVEMLPLSLQPTDEVTALQVIPASAPQDEETTDLLSTLRDETIPAVEEETGVQAYIGGFTAVTVDFTAMLTSALPVFLLIVVGFGFVALVILFRSILVPLTGAATSLLSLGAALGITTMVFQWGWGAQLIQVDSTGPIFPFVPIMVFSILFGLSMDYQVFLVSRMQEEWLHSGDNKKAVRLGLGGSGRVVVIAALIMASVFLAFVPSPTQEIKIFGVALGSAVLIDAFVVRLVLVPSLMTIFGKANWWLPGPLKRVLPEVRIETDEDAAPTIEEVSEEAQPAAR